MIVALLITAGLALCLFDGAQEDDHALSRDLCMGLIAVAMTYLLLIGPLTTDRTIDRPVWLPVAVSISVLDPPPRPFARS
jgi:hypothetical protein